MTEEQIKDAASSYIADKMKQGIPLGHCDTFKAGAKWAFEQQGWISIDKCLPEKGIECIISDTGYFLFAEYIGYESGRGHGFYNRLGQNYFPSHWMPIPEPPKTDTYGIHLPG